MSNTLFPWQKTNWQQIVDRIKKNRLPHAFLFVGEKGVGKRHFANVLSSALLCSDFQKNEAPCLSCRACQLTAAGSHPDLIKIENEKGHPIKVDQIRDLTHSLSQTALMGGYQIVIIDSASSMNINAANALLKTLEEPAGKALLILISSGDLHLPATILSRCQKMYFSVPSLELSLPWLKERITDPLVNLSLIMNIAKGAPLAALEFFEQGLYQLRQDFYHGLSQVSLINVLDWVEKWYEQNAFVILEWLHSWCRDLLYFKSTQDKSGLVNQDVEHFFIKISQKLSFHHLLSYIDLIQKTILTLKEGYNLNQRLLFEELFIKWAKYVG